MELKRGMTVLKLGKSVNGRKVVHLPAGTKVKMVFDNRRMESVYVVSSGEYRGKYAMI